MLANVSRGGSLRARYLSGAAWSFLGTLIAQIVLMASTALISRILDNADFGAFILLQGTVTMLAVFAALGFGTLGTRYCAALKNSDPDRLTRILTLGFVSIFSFGTITLVLFILLSGHVADYVFGDSHIKPALWLASGTLIFLAMDGFFKSILIGFERLKQVAHLSVIGAIFSLLITVSLTNSYGLFGAAGGMAASSLVQVVMSGYAVKQFGVAGKMRLYGDHWREERRLITSFGVPALIANIIVPASIWFSQTLLTRSDNGLAEVALFGIAMQWFNAILFVPTVANRVLMPLLTELVHEEKRSDTAQIVMYALILNCTLTLLISIGISVFGDNVLSFYGKAYADGKAVLILISIAAALASSISVTGNLISAHSKMWLGSAMNFAWSMCFILVAFGLIQNGYGAFGAAIGLVVAYIFHVTWSAVWLRKVLRVGR